MTVTDANGCRASGSGAFRWRDCIGQLTHTSTTCADFMAGTGQDFADVSYVIKDNIITSISPGVFFYYTRVTAPSTDFTINIVQTKDNFAFPFCEVQQDQVVLYDSDCNRVASGAQTLPGQAAIDVRGATVGQVFIVSVKYSLKTLVGTYMDPTMGVRYGFRTEINGIIVDADPNGLQIGAVGKASVGVGPTSDPEGLELYRPVPNPFSSGMRMAYAVGAARDRVNISVFDLAGRLVRELTNGFQAPGRHLVSWDGRDERGGRVHRGMYFVHIGIGNQARHVRVTFVN